MNVIAPAIIAVLASVCVAADITTDDDRTPDLVEAIRMGNPTRARRLLESGIPATTVSSDGDTPLCAALRAGLGDLAADLLEKGADATACGPDRWSPLLLASLRRHPKVMELLLRSGANPNAPLTVPVPPDLLATVTDDRLRGLLQREQRLTPLMMASIRGDVEAVGLLLKARADREARTSPHRYEALDFAAEKGFVFVMRLLLGRHPDQEPGVVVTVNLGRQKAVLEVAGETKLETTISTGRQGFATPEGRYVVTHKYKEWKSTIYKVPMPFFMRLNSGNFGLHSGYVTGAPASHGCIRLPDAMARKFYEIITVGDEVIIEP